MAADGEYVTGHCLCMYNTDINISCNWHMVLWDWSGVDGSGDW